VPEWSGGGTAAAVTALGTLAWRVRGQRGARAEMQRIRRPGSLLRRARLRSASPRAGRFFFWPLLAAFSLRTLYASSVRIGQGPLGRRMRHRQRAPATMQSRLFDAVSGRRRVLVEREKCGELGGESSRLGVGGGRCGLTQILKSEHLVYQLHQVC
jgi:hypothetical protein